MIFAEADRTHPAPSQVAVRTVTRYVQSAPPLSLPVPAVPAPSVGEGEKEAADASSPGSTRKKIACRTTPSLINKLAGESPNLE